jgi:hypothetical protein
MEFVRRLQNHLNQVLANLQQNHKSFDVEDFFEIHRKVKKYLEALNEAFGFIFVTTFLEISGSMIPTIYKSILTITQSNSEISIIYTVNSFVWASFTYYHLARFVFECDKMEEEVIKFSSLVNWFP